MTSNAYIKLVPSSAKQTVTTDDVKELLQYYQQITAKTGTEVDWKYEQVAFPYEIKEKPGDKWLYLASTHDRYHTILLGVDQETIKDEDGNATVQTYIQISLPNSSTFGDKGKATEFCRFLAKKLQGELHLFNGRIMYYNPRK